MFCDQKGCSLRAKYDFSVTNEVNVPDRQEEWQLKIKSHNLCCGRHARRAEKKSIELARAMSKTAVKLGASGNFIVERILLNGDPFRGKISTEIFRTD